MMKHLFTLSEFIDEHEGYCNIYRPSGKDFYCGDIKKVFDEKRDLYKSCCVDIISTIYPINCDFACYDLILHSEY